MVPFYFHVQGQGKMEGLEVAGYETLDPPMLMFANDALLRGGVRVRVWIREQRKIKRISKALLSL